MGYSESAEWAYEHGGGAQRSEAERYVVGTFYGEAAVIDTEPPIRLVIAKCGNPEHAEMIAEALNRSPGQVVEGDVLP